MKNILKKLALFTSIIVSAVSVSLSVKADSGNLPDGTPVNTGDTYRIQQQENGDLTIITKDKVKTSDISYHTIGITLTEIRADGSDGNKIRLDWSNTLSQQNGLTVQNNFTVTQADIISTAALVSPTWAAQIQAAINGQGSCQIRMDSIMEVLHNGMPTGDYYGVMPGMKSMNDLMNAEAWANKYGIKTHFDHFLEFNQLGNMTDEIMGKDDLDKIDKDSPLHTKNNNGGNSGNGDGEGKYDVEVDVDYTVDHKGGSGNATCGVGMGAPVLNAVNQPMFQMGNWSDIYNLGDGIPSSEQVKDKVQIDKWHAYANPWARSVAKGYFRVVTYEWPEYRQVGPDKNGNYTTEEYWEQVRIGVGGYGIVAFQYLRYANMYEFNSATVHNDCFDGDKVSYSGSVGSVNVQCRATGGDKVTVGGTGAQNWIASNGEHIQWPDEGSVLPPPVHTLHSADELEAAVQSDIGYVKSRLQATVKTHNDKLNIAGITLMDDGEVTGCMFLEEIEDDKLPTWESLDESSGYVHQYAKGTLKGTDPEDFEGTTTTTIPPTVDNGQYYTSMEVHYTNRIVTPSEASSFMAGSGTPPRSVSNIGGEHIIEGYAGNEPIFIHTPVIAPVTIRDEHGNKLQGADGKGLETTQLAPSRLNTDCVQLILDNDYIIHWEDFLHTEHQGYTSENSHKSDVHYDKYVKDKWVRFPFSVVYEGKFYETKPISDSERTIGESGSTFYKSEAINTNIYRQYWGRL